MQKGGGVEDNVGGSGGGGCDDVVGRCDDSVCGYASTKYIRCTLAA